MKVYLGSKKNFYKANLHCHTRYSDGRASREDVKREYLSRGYSAVAFTDHEHTIDTSELTDENFVAINGCELSVHGRKLDTDSPRPSGVVTHMCFLAKDPSNDLTPCYSEKYDFYKFDDVRHLVKREGDYQRSHTPEGINEMIRIAHEKGFLVSYNHPAWSLENGCDYLNYDGFDFVEVHNTGCEKTGHPTEELVYHEMLKAGKRVKCIATDDNHNIFGFDHVRSDSFGGWVMINADELNYASLIEGLESGDFYASTGPELYSITLGDDLTVTATFEKGMRRAVILTQGRRVAPCYEVEEGEAVFKLHPSDISFRIRIDDSEGHSAYSQQYDLPEDVREILRERAEAELEAKRKEAEAKAAEKKD